MAARRARPPRSQVRAMALAALFLALPLFGAGCLDEVVPGDRPLSLIEAYRVAQPAALEVDDNANLVGFVGHEGPAPVFLQGVLGHYVVEEDTSRDDARGDGRALVWALLFAAVIDAKQTRMIQTVVHADPVTVDTKVFDPSEDTLLRDLWALNMGGRLLIDSPQAMMTVRDSGTPTAAWLATQTAPNIVYASSVVPLGPDGGTHDLVHDMYFGYGAGEEGAYAHYAQVGHYDGDLVAEGEEKAHQTARRVTLVDREFRLTPLAPSARVQEELPTTVREVALDLAVSGTGRFDLSVAGQQGEVVRIQDDLVATGKHYDEALGTLAPDTYTLDVATTGDLTFHLVITGVAGL